MGGCLVGGGLVVGARVGDGATGTFHKQRVLATQLVDLLKCIQALI